MTTLSLNRRSRSALTAQARAGLRALLALAGEDPDRAGLADTPDRVIRAVEEMTRKPDA
jgi:GTP cyclohydrolase I